MTHDRREHFEATWQAAQRLASRDIIRNIRVQRASTVLLPGDRLLDVGCGAGELAEAVAGRYREVHGVDLSPGAVAEAAQRGVLARVCDAGSDPLPYDDASFDAVALLSVMQFTVDVDRLLREIRRVLRSGGQLVVVVPNLRAAWRLLRLAVSGRMPRTSLDPRGVDGGTLHYFTYGTARSQVEAGGFEVASSCGIHCRPRFLEGRADWGPAGVVKREFFSAEVLLDARAHRAAATPIRSPA